MARIPLRLFRNQVEEHGGVYKFTKTAVCKVSPNPQVRRLNLSSCVLQPLVSHENLFYARSLSIASLPTSLSRRDACHILSRFEEFDHVSPQIPSPTKPLGVASDPVVVVSRSILLKSASDYPRSSPFKAVQDGADTDVEEAELSDVALDYADTLSPTSYRMAIEGTYSGQGCLYGKGGR